MHQVGGYDPPKVCVMQPLCGPNRMRHGQEGPQSGGKKWWWWRRRRVPPPPLRGKPPPPHPSHQRWPRWRPSPPPPADLDVGALAATVATHVTGTCQILVEQKAVTGVEAA